uniref:Resolvase/invertase-type recombinase catalytic domain-containing protein n=1 Tax=Actinobacillus porcitonsillarum TaxID=189834 RepID=Q4W2T6_9PAST|nr:recombinase family protein [Actinobacillus porcitonsillarum]CAH25820.1 hypothetical protein [Actinobacillus porcitonsillarum]
MQKVIGYVRVSTDKQDAEKQWNTVLNYANSELKTPIEKVEDTESGKIEWRKRSLGKIVDECEKGDIIVVSEISRIERSTLGVLELLKVTSEKGVQVHIVQQGLQFKGQDDIATKVLATTLGMIAEIEREFISQRTKNALAKLKADGKKLGRPKGRAKSYKLDKYRNDIISYLEKGLNKTAIAKLIGVSVPTLNAFLKRESL